MVALDNKMKVVHVYVTQINTYYFVLFSMFPFLEARNINIQLIEITNNNYQTICLQSSRLHSVRRGGKNGSW